MELRQIFLEPGGKIMAINKLVILLALLAPSIAMACPESGWSKFSGKLFYEQKDAQSGEIEGIQIGWTSAQLRQYLSDQELEKVELVPTNNFYATAECPEELDKITGSSEVWVTGKNMAKIARITMREAQAAEINLVQSSEFPIKQGDSLGTVISQLKELLKSGKAQGVNPTLSCKNECLVKFKDLSLSSEPLAFRYVTKDQRGRITVYLSADRVIRVSYLRQRFQGDGVL
ncbi:hypothetical protein [Pseudomonas sp. PIC25]|uniref:hypothetical protein n=1 Tax=Pseudomonas sp. PIC25 TaxID=1958773 RepID=UPI00143CD2C2|nr:hypothetical protein [Pseudomonas sp. PIC25]